MTALWIIGVLAAAGILLAAFLTTRRRRFRRELLEDALKHLYNCEYTRISCTLDSLAGALGRRREQLSAVVNDLSARRLMTLEGPELRLTPQGREYALRVIRVHRLWERHLADETGVPETDWHKRAEAKEHRLQQEEISELSRRLGHPVYDPHGDPIPRADGSLPSVRGRNLQSFDPGSVVRVTHVEDEPPSVYADLVDMEFHPGAGVKILARSPDTITVEMGGVERVVPLVAAANIRAVPARAGLSTGPRRTLASLEPGRRGIVAEISQTCRGMQRRRLMDLGIVPGTPVTALMRSATGDPTAYKIRGGTVALRKEQAEMIVLKEESEE